MSSRLTDPQFRILDANTNRAREGLRLLEEHARYVLERADLAAEARDLRHQLTSRIQASGLDMVNLLMARDVAHDVGAQPAGRELSSPGDAPPSDALGAAAGRAAEALRVIEEVVPAVAELRYRVYDLERAVRLSTPRPALTPAKPRVYLIWDLDACTGDPVAVLDAALEGGVEWVQLRAKCAPAHQAMELGRIARMRTLARGATLIVNDRADLAQLVGADGLHVGPDDLRPSSARRLLGRDAIIGATTHSLEEIQVAYTEPIDYVGFGPIGATSTKSGAPAPIGVESFAALPEPFKLRTIPIGGIGVELARELAHAGARQVAVGAAILESADPAAAAAEILDAMESA